MLPLRELVNGLDLHLVAGREGLERPVRWVHISELPDPTPWLSGGEPPLIAGPEQFEEMEAVLRPVLEEASRRMLHH
jgi:purine catabolism regulator